MSEMTAIVDLLARTDRDFAHTQRRSHRTKVVLYAILGPLYAFALGIAVTMLIRLWQGADPLIEFWVPFLFSLSMAVHIVRMYVSFGSDSRAPLFAPIASLREAIRAGDTTLAPIVAHDSSLVPSTSGSATTHIGPLRRPIKWSNPFVVLALIVLVAACVGVPPALAFISIRAGMILGVVLLSLATILCLLAYRAVGPVSVRVDAEGMRWPRLLGGYHRLLWRDAQALCQLGDVRMFLDDRKTTHILYGTRRVFTWNITGSSRRQRERAASQALLDTITSHTSLPARDVTAEARRLAYQAQDPWVPHKLTSQERNYRLRVAGIVLLPFIVMALFAGTFQIAGPWYFDRLYAQAQASAPLYADPLTHKDSDWAETDTTRFAGGAYTITHNLELFGVHPSLILPPHHYDHALYEVTAHATGDTNAGLAILGASRSQPMLAFYAAPDGTWWLMQVTSDGSIDIDHLFSRLGDSAAILRGSGAPNRIGILIQGSDFTFYINGRYITRYHDDQLAGGYTGLFLDPEPGQGAFTEFAIYPT